MWKPAEMKIKRKQNKGRIDVMWKPAEMKIKRKQNKGRIE